MYGSIPAGAWQQQPPQPWSPATSALQPPTARGRGGGVGAHAVVMNSCSINALRGHKKRAAVCMAAEGWLARERLISAGRRDACTCISTQPCVSCHMPYRSTDSSKSVVHGSSLLHARRQHTLQVGTWLVVNQQCMQDCMRGLQALHIAQCVGMAAP
eukprot:jgi/Chrzof1/14960/Cz09g22090.t1